MCYIIWVDHVTRSSDHDIIELMLTGKSLKSNITNLVT